MGHFRKKRNVPCFFMEKTGKIQEKYRKNTGKIQEFHRMFGVKIW